MIFERGYIMEKKFADIINEGCKSGKTVEQINQALKAAGANFHLDHDGRVSGWTDQEMQEGFIPAEKEPEDVKHLHDYMRFCPENAGKTLRVTVPEGTYDVTWNEDGNPVKAVRHG